MRLKQFLFNYFIDNKVITVEQIIEHFKNSKFDEIMNELMIYENLGLIKYITQCKIIDNNELFSYTIEQCIDENETIVYLLHPSKNNINENIVIGRFNLNTLLNLTPYQLDSDWGEFEKSNQKKYDFYDEFFSELIISTTPNIKDKIYIEDFFYNKWIKINI